MKIRARTAFPSAARLAPSLALGLALASPATTALAASGSNGSQPCPDRGNTIVMEGALPRFAARLASGSPLTIVTIGSSSTAGAGASSPDRNYPSRLGVAMRGRHPGRRIEVLNAGVNGQEVPEMLARLDRDVIAHDPDLVIWQFGSNSLLRQSPLDALERGAREGIGRLQASGVEVVMMDLQHAPRIDRLAARDDVLAMMRRLHQSTGAPLFHRYRLMKAWAMAMGPGYGAMVASDQLHLTDASYGCLANALADGLETAMAASAPEVIARTQEDQPGVSTRSTNNITMSARVPLSQPR